MFDTVSTDPALCPETGFVARWQGGDPVMAPAGWRRLEALPVGMFGSVMALTTLGVAWRVAHDDYGTPIWIADVLMALGVAAFVLLTIGYGVKLAIAPGAVRAEFRHPITGPLFGTIPISLLLLPIALAPLSPGLATALWTLGAVGAVTLAWLIVGRWLGGRQSLAHVTPAWIIPVVGVLSIPLAMPSLDLPPMHGVEAFGFGVGMCLAVPVLTLVCGRLVAGPPLANALEASVLVLLAPIATGFMTYVTVMQKLDPFSKSLYFTMEFLLAVLLPRLRHLGRCCPLRVSWWAIGFPLAMTCLPALHFAAAEPRLGPNAVAIVLLALATVTAAGLFCQTVIGLVHATTGRVEPRATISNGSSIRGEVAMAPERRPSTSSAASHPMR